MGSLEELQTHGMIPRSIKEITPTYAVTLSEFLGWDEKERSGYKGAVLLDDWKWVGTVAGAPTTEAKNVYSSNGEGTVGKWNKDRCTFYKMVKQGNHLVTNDILKFKEENSSMGIIDDSALMEALGDLGEGTKPATAFEDKAATPEGETEKERAKREEKEHYDGIRKQLVDAFTGDVMLPADIIRNNRQHGAVLCFITGTDHVVKMSKSTKLVSVNGKSVLKSNAPDDIAAKFRKGEKVAKQYLETETTIGFRDSKPGKAKAAVIATPADTAVPLTSVGSEIRLDANAKAGDMKIMMMDMDAAAAWISFNFDGTIKESEAVLGAKRDSLNVIHKISQKKNKDGSTTDCVVTNLKPSKRKNLLIDGNYVPMKVYDTISLQDPTAENKAALNLNLEAILARSADEMCEEVRTKYKVDENGTVVSSAWVDNGEAIQVARFDNPDVFISDVRLPRREKVAKKSGDGFTYKFKCFELEDEQNGPLADATFAEIVKSTGFTNEEFRAEVARVTRRKSSGGSQRANNLISHEDFLRGYMGKDALVASGGRSLAQIQSILDEID